MLLRSRKTQALYFPISLAGYSVHESVVFCEKRAMEKLSDYSFLFREFMWNKSILNEHVNSKMNSKVDISLLRNKIYSTTSNVKCYSPHSHVTQS